MNVLLTVLVWTLKITWWFVAGCLALVFLPVWLIFSPRTGARTYWVQSGYRMKNFVFWETP